MSAYKQQRSSYLDDYVGVATRVSQFHEKYPNGRIVTEFQVTENGCVIFHAKVYRNLEDAEPSATGTSIETIDLQKSSFEKTETASVGRALAFLNFETKKGLASREEMERHEERQARPQAVTKPVAVESSERNWHEEIGHLWKQLRAVGHEKFKTPELMMAHFKTLAKSKQWAERLQEVEKITDIPDATARAYVSILMDIYTAAKEGV